MAAAAAALLATAGLAFAAAGLRTVPITIRHLPHVAPSPASDHPIEETAQW